ncbi:MAG TPA: tetratricopeptide repeat protein, partial [Candidatus Obscuribacterales bacterium]
MGTSNKINWTEVSESGYQALLRGNFDEAEKCFRLAIEKGGFEQTDVRLAYSFLVLGKCFILRGDYVGAEPLYRRALEIYERAYGQEHKDVGLSLVGLAKCNMQCGKYTEAQLLYTRVISIYEKVYSKDHEEVGNVLENLSQCYVNQRDHARAIPLYDRVIEIFTKAHGPTHEFVASAMFAQARCYDERNEDKKAEPLFHRALEIYENQQKKNLDQIANIRYNLGRTYHGQRDFSNAERWYRRAIDGFEKAQGMERQSAYAMFGLATCYMSSGDYRADQTFKKCQAAYDKLFGPEDMHMAYLYDAYARLMHNTCRIDEGKRLEKRAQDIRDKQDKRRLL